MDRPVRDPQPGLRHRRPSSTGTAVAVGAVLLAASVSSSILPGREVSAAVAGEEVEFVSRDARLRGTVFRPAGEGPVPALALVHGSGLQTRHVHRDVAEFLASRGFVVLAYDKRGVGESSGSYRGVGAGNSEEMFDTLAADALAAVRTLRARGDVLPGRVGLMGFSQAGWIIPLAASRDPDVAFAVIVSGPTVTVGEEIYYSALTGEYLGSPSELQPETISGMLDAYHGPYGFDPLPSLEAMRAPGLWIFGGRDRSIPVSESVAILERLRQERGKDFTVRLFPSGNHGLFDVEAGRAIDFLPTVEAWLRPRVAEGPKPRDQTGAAGAADGF